MIAVPEALVADIIRALNAGGNKEGGYATAAKLSALLRVYREPNPSATDRELARRLLGGQR